MSLALFSPDRLNKARDILDWNVHVFLTLEDTILLSQNLGGMNASVAEQEWRPT